MPEIIDKYLLSNFIDSVSVKPDYKEDLENIYGKVYDTYVNKIYNSHIDYNKYPEQNTSFLNTLVNIKIRILQSGNSKIERVPSIGRPEDDVAFSIPEERPDDIDFSYFTYKDVLVLRFDKEEPYRMIGITKDCKYMIISSSKPNEEGYEFMSLVAEYPMQNQLLIKYGRTMYDYFKSEETKYRNAAILSINEKSPFNGIIVEYLEDDSARFILSDELAFNYNEEPEENIVLELTESELANYRKQAIKDKILYPTSDIIDI